MSRVADEPFDDAGLIMEALLEIRANVRRIAGLHEDEDEDGEEEEEDS
jgi:hypothetical protein